MGREPLSHGERARTAAADARRAAEARALIQDRLVRIRAGAYEPGEQPLPLPGHDPGEAARRVWSAALRRSEAMLKLAAAHERCALLRERLAGCAGPDDGADLRLARWHRHLARRLRVLAGARSAAYPNTRR
ncbi:hypothetical protein AB0K40_35990 [Nonomuraea bangladeshensis]|uniref:DUF4254 domain-containing protein n=1 Tax=Nonomuraea bangladeshensis TaxID=404385 RepID=A0ABV3HEI2_9ACTN